MSDSALSERPTWSWSGFWIGMRMGLPITPGIFAFGLATGAVAARQGLTFAQHLGMNVIVYSGIVQIVALEIWPKVFTWGTVAAMAILAGVVGARLFLMSVAMRPWFGSLPAWQSYPSLFYLTDPSYLIVMRYRAEGGNDAGVFLGSAAAFLGAWMIAICIGFFAGNLISDPARYGVDLVMPVFFAAMLIPLWNGPRRAIGWAVAAVVAIAVQHFVEGWWFIVAGSVTGAVAGGFIDEDRT